MSVDEDLQSVQQHYGVTRAERVLGVGIIGCGWISDVVHMPNLEAHPDVRVTAFADRTRLQVGDPLVLVVRITGEAPSLGHDPERPDLRQFPDRNRLLIFQHLDVQQGRNRLQVVFDPVIRLSHRLLQPQVTRLHTRQAPRYDRRRSGPRGAGDLATRARLRSREPVWIRRDSPHREPKLAQPTGINNGY